MALAATSAIGEALRAIVGPRAVLDTENELMLYEYDGGLQRSTPQAVVFPQTTEQVAAIVKLAAEEKLPILARGAGTGLSGGAVAISGGIVLSTARMNRIIELDFANLRAVVQPGVVNLEITQAAAPHGYFTRPIRRAKKRAPSAETSRRMRAVPTRWRTASPRITWSASKWCCPMDRSFAPAARRPILPATISPDCSSVPRARSAS